ncbi:hypothetical protein [Leekyejoonella antrihumi]|uniref:Carboxypeptidase regulatory-like domain-containing protein n=1 Tax=Leekyejoonella antrihumi TaxID=1660198 RepID=A0A563E6Z2_9MICO|nr:hypothetical protein [Leekyejoonella antrihumi]TWP38195.1 hypothetical protein FGL98_02905 [Leekyejoonella antrihumi]
MDNDIQFADLAEMWQSHDPAPPGLVERALVAIEMEDLDAEYELLHIVERGRTLVGTRGDQAETLTIVFSGNDCSLMMRISPLDGDCRRVDGWVSPPRPVRVSLKQQETAFDSTSDAKGRFEIARMPHGLARAVLSSLPAPDGTAHVEHTEQLFATPAFEV